MNALLAEQRHTMGRIEQKYTKKSETVKRLNKKVNTMEINIEHYQLLVKLLQKSLFNENQATPRKKLRKNKYNPVEIDETSVPIATKELVHIKKEKQVGAELCQAQAQSG